MLRPSATYLTAKGLDAFPELAFDWWRKEYEMERQGRIFYAPKEKRYRVRAQSKEEKLYCPCFLVWHLLSHAKLLPGLLFDFSCPISSINPCSLRPELSLLHLSFWSLKWLPPPCGQPPCFSSFNCLKIIGPSEALLFSYWSSQVENHLF